eukprot:TRINITY_DN24290_c0_g1_i4.p1 TRINITY_DN24290_c0_g1~~TRINITY_DN24290_c0_g1_i4.p1  ORF type:complete len:402 (+),score=-7.48 TRINITY_DN24290_c0_g1_i4:193-1398(+)
MAKHRSFASLRNARDALLLVSIVLCARVATVSAATSSLPPRAVNNPSDPLGGYSSPTFPSQNGNASPAVGNNGKYAGPRSTDQSAPVGAMDGDTSTSSTCLASNLTGYTSMAVLEDNSLFLHWTLVAQDTVAIALEAIVGGGAARGWIALGWSNSSAMAPADAVIGNLDGGNPVATYSILGYTAADVVPTDTFSVGPSASVELTGWRTIVRFSRSTGDGGMNPVNVAGVNALIWAHSLVGNQSVDYHAGKRGSLIVDFSCSGGDTYTPSVPVPATGGGAVGQQPGAGGNCPPSYITGYQHLVQLDGNGLVLHWRTPVNGVLNLVLEATKTSAAYGGWVSVGWSQTGAMAPADAVVGSLTKGVAAYHIDGYRARNVYTTSAFSLGRNATVLTSPWSKSLIVK